jgi:hypothetical protein
MDDDKSNQKFGIGIIVDDNNYPKNCGMKLVRRERVRVWWPMPDEDPEPYSWTERVVS